MSKLLYSAVSGLTDPLGFLWACLLGATLLAAWKRRWSAFSLALVVVLFLQVTAGTNLAQLLLGHLEAPYNPVRNPLPERADAVVMLGGTLDYGPRERLRLQLGDAADRIVTAADLMREGRAPVLVLSSAPYLLHDERRPDSELIAAWFRTWRLPTGELLRLPLCGNTHDEARHVAALSAERGWKRILLVTSAYHLRRSVATFQHAGLTNVVPVGCDFHGDDSPNTRLKFLGLPSTGRLQLLNCWTHEQAGWWYYRLRGWR